MNVNKTRYRKGFNGMAFDETEILLNLLYNVYRATFVFFENVAHVSSDDANQDK